MQRYSLPELPYAYDALEPNLSSEILDLHYNKHHAAYVEGVNDTLEQLEQARSENSFAHIGQLEKSLAFNLSGHVLHSLLWKNLSPQGGGQPKGELGAALDEHFGSFDAFKAASALAIARGDLEREALRPHSSSIASP
jgi:Fe-Mn family superoxide dismutase